MWIDECAMFLIVWVHRSATIETNRFGRHFSQYHQALANPSQYLFIFGSQPSLSTSCLRTPQNSSTGWSYGTARGAFSTPMGLKMGISALFLSTIHLLPLFQLWPELRMSDSRVCLNSSLPHNSVDQGPVSIHLFSQFHWGDSLLVPDGLDELVPLLFCHLYCSSSAFCFSFCGFSCLYALAHSANGGPGQSDLHKISYKHQISKICIFPVDSSKHICVDLLPRVTVSLSFLSHFFVTRPYKINHECMLCVCLNNVRFTTNDFCLHNTGLKQRMYIASRTSRCCFDRQRNKTVKSESR